MFLSPGSGEKLPGARIHPTNMHEAGAVPAAVDSGQTRPVSRLPSMTGVPREDAEGSGPRGKEAAPISTVCQGSRGQQRHSGCVLPAPAQPDRLPSIYKQGNRQKEEGSNALQVTKFMWQKGNGTAGAQSVPPPSVQRSGGVWGPSPRGLSGTSPWVPAPRQGGPHQDGGLVP